MAPALSLLAGCLLPWLLPSAPHWALLLVLALSAMALLRWPLGRLWALLVLGLLLSEWQLARGLQARLPDAAASEVLSLTGQVIGLPETRERALQFEFAIHTPPAQAPALRRLRLSWYDNPPELPAGSRWRLEVKLKRPHGQVNPSGFDFERFALADRLDAVGYVLRGEALGNAAFSIDRLRELGSARLAAALEPGRSQALLQALVYGDTRALTAADWSLFRNTGTTHLIAISGSHIGIVALGTGVLVAALWPFMGGLRRWPRLLVASSVGWASAFWYCLLAGFEIPAQRTLLGITVVTVALLWRRQLGAWTTFNAALLAVLLYDPLSPLSAGFWLSFGAVAWLLLIFAGRWRRPHWSQELIEAQVKIALLMLPLTLLLFQQAAWIAPLTNLWAVPLVSVLLVPLALLGTLLLPVPVLGDILLQAAQLLADAWLYGLDHSATSSLADWSLPVPSVLSMLLALLGAVLLLAPRGFPARWLAPVLWLPLFWPVQPILPNGRFELLVFDVGQGLSVLVRTREHALLYDTGPGREAGQPLAASTVLPSLGLLGLRKLDALVVSHGDDDHAGGTEAICAAMPVARFYGSAPTEAAEACLQGQRWTWDGVEFQFLHPTPGLPYLGNESSCVLQIRAGPRSALLPGDIGDAIEERLLRQYGKALKAEVLVSPHHGSKGSSSAAFVAAVDPDIVLHATGWQDRFDFPRPDVVNRYHQAGASQFDTGAAGALLLESGTDGSWKVEALRISQPRRWRDPGQALEPNAGMK